MADNKKIEKIEISSEVYDLTDATAIKSINGYAKSAVEGQTVTFATTPISEAEINTALGISNS